MITAYAGCAKSTTLELIANALPAKPSLALAFNVRIKKELERRFPPHFTILTLNGLGHSAFGRALGKRLIVEPNKIGTAVTAVAKAQRLTLDSAEWTTVRQLVTAAMHAGLVPQGFPQKGLVPDREEIWQDLADNAQADAPPEAIELARAVLSESIRQSYAGVISYDCQIYMSALFGGAFPRFPLVMVDEAQDLSPLNRVQVQKCAADRLIIVGDQKQAIYQFRGADHNSIANLRTLRPEWIDLPLATTFRCPKIIVERSRDHAPGFTAWPTNAAGRVHQLLRGDDREHWTWAEVQALVPDGKDVAVLCRNNAPILALAFKLIRQGVAPVMLGRDIGKGLIALSKKILPLDDTPAAECVTLIDQWYESEASLARANEREEKLAGLSDRAESLHAVLANGPCATAKDLRKKLDELFSRESGRVTLSSIHRAKGLEWDVVLHLDPWRIPSKHAKKAASRGDTAPLQQELNLRYVCETRTKSTLVLACLEDFQ